MDETISPPAADLEINVIKFHRDDKLSIWLTFNLAGLENLIKAFKGALRREVESINALMDMSVITLKKKATEKMVSIEIRLGKSTLIAKHEEQIFWYFEKEVLEDAIGRLDRCLAENNFYPAEFIRVKVSKNKKLDYIYCDLRNESIEELKK